MRSLLFLPVLLLAATPVADTHETQSLAGSYNIAICKRQPCTPDDTTNVVVAGTVVLSDTTYKMAAFPDSARIALMRFTTMGPRNGCSVTAARRPGTRTFASLGGVELIAWKAEPPNGVSFELHQSPNTAYRLQLTFTGDRFRGTGKSWSSSGIAPAYPDDIVAGRRLGAPDHKPCADSAMAAARKK